MGLHDHVLQDKEKPEKFFNDEEQINNYKFDNEIFNSDCKSPVVEPKRIKRNVRNIAYEFKQKRQIFDILKKLVHKKYFYERYAENYYYGLLMKKKRVIFNVLYKSMTDAKAQKLNKELNQAKNEIIKLKVEINKSENKKLEEIQTSITSIHSPASKAISKNSISSKKSAIKLPQKTSSSATTIKTKMKKPSRLFSTASKTPLPSTSAVAVDIHSNPNQSKTIIPKNTNKSSPSLKTTKNASLQRTNNDKGNKGIGNSFSKYILIDLECNCFRFKGFGIIKLSIIKIVKGGITIQNQSLIKIIDTLLLFFIP